MKVKTRIIVLEKSKINVREPNFCGPYCSLVCGGLIIAPD